MEREATVSLSELRRLSSRLFDHAEARGIDRVLIEQPLHWRVAAGTAFDLSTAPEPTLGDVFEDIGDLREEVESVNPNLWHAFDHLAGLMQFIADADLRAGYPGLGKTGV